MRLSLQFPTIVYLEGPEAVAQIARVAELVGFDQIDFFDHVVMGHPMEGRDPGPYPAELPILEPLAALGFVAAVTERIGLGVEVLVLPQRQPALVAKQISTLDTLSAGRIRVGLGVGWQECEYEALGTDFHKRGSMLDEAIPLLREAIEFCESCNDFVSRDLFAAILDSEEEHVDWLETQLALMDQVGVENYLQAKIG